MAHFGGLTKEDKEVVRPPQLSFLLDKVIALIGRVSVDSDKIFPLISSSPLS